MSGASSSRGIVVIVVLEVLRLPVNNLEGVSAIEANPRVRNAGFNVVRTARRAHRDRVHVGPNFFVISAPAITPVFSVGTTGLLSYHAFAYTTAPQPFFQFF